MGSLAMLFAHVLHEWAWLNNYWHWFDSTNRNQGYSCYGYDIFSWLLADLVRKFEENQRRCLTIDVLFWQTLLTLDTQHKAFTHCYTYTSINTLQNTKYLRAGKLCRFLTFTVMISIENCITFFLDTCILDTEKSLFPKSYQSTSDWLQESVVENLLKLQQTSKSEFHQDYPFSTFKLSRTLLLSIVILHY